MLHFVRQRPVNSTSTLAQLSSLQTALSAPHLAVRRMQRLNILTNVLRYQQHS